MNSKYRKKELLNGFGLSLAIYVGISVLLNIFIFPPKDYFLGFVYGGLLYLFVFIVLLMFNHKIEERIHGILLSFALIILIAYSACYSYVDFVLLRANNTYHFKSYQSVHTSTDAFRYPCFDTHKSLLISHCSTPSSIISHTEN